MEQLKSCPFCGGEASVDVDDDGYYVVGCDEDCRCPCNVFYTNQGYYTEKEAIEVWNKRVGDSNG